MSTLKRTACNALQCLSKLCKASSPCRPGSLTKAHAVRDGTSAQEQGPGDGVGGGVGDLQAVAGLQQRVNGEEGCRVKSVAEQRVRNDEQINCVKGGLWRVTAPSARRSGLLIVFPQRHYAHLPIHLDGVLHRADDGARALEQVGRRVQLRGAVVRHVAAAHKHLLGKLEERIESVWRERGGGEAREVSRAVVGRIAARRMCEGGGQKRQHAWSASACCQAATHPAVGEEDGGGVVEAGAHVLCQGALGSELVCRRGGVGGWVRQGVGSVRQGEVSLARH